MRRILLSILTVVSAAVYMQQYITHDKMTASWGWFNVSVVGLILSAIVALIFVALPFFSSDRKTPVGALTLMVVGLILAVYGGIYMTEPKEEGALESAAGLTLPEEQVAEYHRESYARSRAGGHFYYWFYPNYYSSSVATPASSGGGGSFSAPSCSGDACEAYMYIFLILLVVILVIGSLFVPHFWVMAGMIFLTVMALTTLREFIFVDNDARKSKFSY